MKRLLLFVIVAFMTTAAFAADGADRDILVLTDGTLYAIEAVPFEDGVSSSLVLTKESNGKTTTSVIPESTSGTNGLPTLDYDADTDTLYVVWMHRDADSNELLVSGFQKDKWEPALVIDSKAVVRSNLSIKFTRQVQTQLRDGSFGDTPALILHAAWWEKGPTGEGAYYAVMPLTPRWQLKSEVHELIEFADISVRTASAPTIDTPFLRQVALVDGPTADSVDAIFADSRDGGNFYRATLRPVALVRIHITVGVHGPKLGAPKQMSFPWNGHGGVITSPDGQTVIFTNTTDEKVSWVTYRGGKWIDVQEIKLSDKVNVTTAMSALAKMAAGSNQ